MVRLLRGHSIEEKLHRRRQKMVEVSSRQGQSMVLEGSPPMGEEMISSRSQGSTSSSKSLEGQQIGSALDKNDKAPKSRLGKDGGGVGGSTESIHSDIKEMKERFAKLLLGEDMSGGGKGVSSALALSNAITNLAASVFGEQRRLEPMAPDRKARWRKEVDWFLSVTDHIVEMVPSQQKSKDGTQMEIMTTQQRTDLHMNIPALRKLDTMLLDYLDNFKDQNEFWYVKRGEDESDNGGPQRNEDKWWLPTVKVPPNGLSEVSRKWLQFQKESVNQVLKAAMAINAQVLSEMEIPDNYLESLPKNGKASLGDTIYRSLGSDYFDPDQFLSTMDLSTEHKILDLKNRIEASIVIWKRKMTDKSGKSSWSSTVSSEKREQFEDRAETILVLLKHRFPGIPQSALDISKIQYNGDVGQAVLESYSRVLESLAYNVMSRIEDVIDADAAARNPSSHHEQRKRHSLDSDFQAGPMKFPNLEEEIMKLNAMGSPASMTLSDFMGWQLDQENQEDEVKKKDTDSADGFLGKPASAIPDKKFSYIESLGVGGLRSPTWRH